VSAETHAFKGMCQKRGNILVEVV